MQKIWIGLVVLSGLSLAACGGSDGRSVAGSAAQVQAYTKVCLQKPVGDLEIKGMIWTMPFSDEQVSGQTSWLFDDNSVSMTFACSSKLDPKSTATVNLKTAIKLAPNQIQLLESKTDEQPVTGGVCRLTTTPMTLAYSFQGSCLRINYPAGDSLVFAPQPTPIPSPSAGTGTVVGQPKPDPAQTSTGTAPAAANPAAPVVPQTGSPQ